MVVVVDGWVCITNNDCPFAFVISVLMCMFLMSNTHPPTHDELDGVIEFYFSFLSILVNRGGCTRYNHSDIIPPLYCVLSTTLLA